MDFVSAGYIVVAAVVGAVIAAVLVSVVMRRRKAAQDPSKQLAKLSGQLSKNKLQSEILINSIGDGIILIGTDGKVNLMNPAAASMTEWTVKDGIGIDAATVVKLAKEDGQDQIPEENPIREVLTNRQPINDMVLQLKGHAQKVLVVSIVISPVINPKYQEFMGAVAVLRDISAARAEERRRADFISTASN
jgi:PAS domain S-box-containing protein